MKAEMVAARFSAPPAHPPKASLLAATCAGMGQTFSIRSAINAVREVRALIWLKAATEFRYPCLLPADGLG
jgi:hypothetical protein